MLFLKLAIVLQLKRIFTGPRKSLTWFLFHALIWLQTVFYTIMMFFNIFICTPRAKITDFSIPGSCLNSGAVLIATSSFNALADFLILLLPLYAISRLRISFRQKLSISAVFAVGFLSVSLVGQTNTVSSC